MNGLVAYDSSSEDEDVNATKFGAKSGDEAIEQKNSATSTASNTDVATQNGPDMNDASMIGPAMPMESSELDESNDLDDISPDMSEQDLIRHLTRSTQPMKAIPPSPPGSPDASIEARFKKYLALKAQGMHFNEDLAKKSSFRNPALFSTLLEKNGLEGSDQYASSLPTSIWDPHALPSYGYKEELARSQQSIRDQQAARKKNAAGKRTIEFAPATGSGTSSQTSTPGEIRRPPGR